MSHDVHLSRNQVPVYPTRCVVCSKDSPEAHLAISAWEGYWWTFSAKTRAFASPPACSACRDHFRRSRLARFLIALAIMAVALIVIRVLIPDGWTRRERRLASFGIGAVAVVAWILVYFIRPLAFALSQPAKNSVVYEFKNAEFAHEFARLNNAEVKR